MKRLLVGSLGLALLGVGSIAVGQETEEESGQNETREVQMAVIDAEGGGAPMIFATEMSSVDGGPAKMRVLAGDSAMMLAGPGLSARFGGGPPDSFSLLNDPSVQKDLELVGDQLEQVRALQADFSAQMKEQIGDLSKGGLRRDRMEGLGELIRQLRDKQRAQMEEVLLPHQIERLKQVALQKHMQNAGTASALISEQVAEALGIDEQQKERLQKRAEEIKADMEKKMAKLREDAKNDLLMELTPTQREQLKEMVGDDFQPQAQDFEEDMKRRIQMRRPTGR